MPSDREDWVCSDPKCDAVNFYKRDKCFQCGKRNRNPQSSKSVKEIGKVMSDKSKGLFSPDDWMCKNCGNINWARRNVCNVCNTSRLNTLGQRTGYGGGFMERDEVVEYKKRGDSDDEFDEFGRKKRRYRKTQDTSEEDEPRAKKSIPISEERGQVELTTEVNQKGNKLGQESSTDEEEDEESGDDADLAKYDIWGVENENSSANGKVASPNNSNTNQPIDGCSGNRTDSISSSGSDSDSSSSSSSEHSKSSSSSTSSSRSASETEVRGKSEDSNLSDRSKSSQKANRKCDNRQRSRFERERGVKLLILLAILFTSFKCFTPSYLRLKIYRLGYVTQCIFLFRRDLRWGYHWC